MKIISIIRKDLITILSDKKALAIILAMPIILMVILSFALKGIFTEDALTEGRVKIAVVKEYDAQEDDKNFTDSLNSGMLLQNLGETTAKDIKSASGDIDPGKIFFHDFLDSKEVSDIITYRIESLKAFE